MGSSREITTAFCLICLCAIASNTLAKPQTQMHEERSEYQYERSSKIRSSTGTGYYNSATGDQVQGMAEKLRNQLTTTEDDYRQRANDCNARCASMPGFTAITDKEINELARDMTNQINEDMQSGRLDRTQVNQPHWYEQLVVQKLKELHGQHMSEYEQNLRTTATRFRQNAAADESVQQTQQNVFNEEDLAQVQQTISNQQQSQHQGGYYQQQSQNQHHSVYTRPVVVVPTNRYHFTQTTQREQTVHQPPPPPPLRTYTELETANHVSEERRQTISPSPAVRTTSQREEEQHTSSSGGVVVVPTLATYNTFDQRESYDRQDKGQVTEPIDRTVTREQAEYERRRYPASPRYNTGGSTYESRNQYEESRRTDNVRPSQPTYHSTYQENSDERRRTQPSVVIVPSQVIANERSEETQRNQIAVRPSFVDREQHSTNVESTQQYNRTTEYVRPTQTTVNTDRRHEERTMVRQEPPPTPSAPVAVSSGTRHSIYNQLDESDTMPNYRPRVVIDQNTEFQVLDQRRDEVQVAQRREEQLYTNKVNRLREYLVRCGFEPLTQSEYNSTIVQGGFAKEGYWHQYNVDSGNFERAERLEAFEHTASLGHHRHMLHTTTTITDEEYTERLSNVRMQLAELGYTGLSDEMYNATVFSGGFTHNGNRYLYNSKTHRFEQSTDTDESQRHVRPDHTDIYDRHDEAEAQKVTLRLRPLPRTVYEIVTDEQYAERLHQIRNELERLGYGQLTSEDYNITIINGGFSHNGFKYVWNDANGRYENTGHREVSASQEYENINREIRRQLQLIGFNTEMSGQELNQTMQTGMFVRGGCKYVYNASTEQYDKSTFSADEKHKIYMRIKEILQRLRYRQISQRENEKLLQQGNLIRGGYRWYYNARGSTLEKSDYVGENAELSEQEYAVIYRNIQETLRKIGYEQMSRQQCNATIASGTFVRGGITWQYNADEDRFERLDLSQSEYRDRMDKLQQALNQIGHRILSAEELRSTVYRGYFHYGGYRYEYDAQTGRFERIELSNEEYQQRLSRLQEQLVRIGFGTMSESQCNETISNGAFYFGGYEWLYNFESGDYDMGERSDRDQSVNANGAQSSVNLNRGQYDTTQEGEIGGGVVERRKPSAISKDRGDQPPQHFNEDYESEEILEQEPGVGFYATHTKPEIGLANPGSYNQFAEQSTTVATPVRQQRPRVPSIYSSERERQTYDSQRTSVPVRPAVVRSEYERRYERNETSYVSTGGMPPVYYATQRTLPSDERVETISEPQPTYAYATEVYTVGSVLDGPRNRRPSMNPRRRSPSDNEDTQTNQKDDQLEDLGQKFVSVDDGQSLVSVDAGQSLVSVDDGQSFVDGDAQRTEDLSQQLVGMDQTADANRQHTEDLRQRQESDDLKELQRMYELQQQGEDLRQRTDDVGQRYETQATGQHHETEDLRQHSDTENYRQHHISENHQDNVQRNDHIRMTYAENRHTDTVQPAGEQVAKVVEVTTAKPGFFRRIFG